MKAIFITLLFLGFTTSFIKAQTIEKFSIDSGGASTIVGDIQILYTIGEVNIQELSTESIGVSEGFINYSESNTLSIGDLDSKKLDFIIYPNPVVDILNISTNLKIIQLSLFDILGKQILVLKDSKYINVSYLNSGVYVLKVKTEAGNLTEKIVIK